MKCYNLKHFLSLPMPNDTLEQNLYGILVSMKVSVAL
jgi:hypothetical protein